MTNYELSSPSINDNGKTSEEKAQISNINIKEICRRFEGLNDSDKSRSKVYPASNAPIAPLRKRKSAALFVSKSVDSTPVSIKTNYSDEGGSTSVFNTNSVKAKTKLFELPNEVCNKDKIVLPETFEPPVVLDKKIISVKKLSNDNLKPFQNVSPVYVNTPPTKPPRTFVCSDAISTLKSSDIKDNERIHASSKIENQMKSCNISNSACLKPRKVSFGTECEAIKEDILKNLKIHNTADVFSAAIDNVSKSQVKSQITPSKTQGLKNCLKSLSSTANTICEKVRKRSSVFVDLTPTTVSPPKHYGTLKRSLSEEHIYAELTTVHKTSSSPVPEQSVGAEPLHYMCTPVIEPRQKVHERKCQSRHSVRNMIYDSFASLRSTSKDNHETTDSATIVVEDTCEVDVSTKAIEDRIIYVRSVRKQNSASSLCVSPKLFEALLLVNLKNNQPEISASFPSKVPDAYDYPLLPHICFPNVSLYKIASNYQSETFHFSLLDKSEKIFGYCLRIMGWSKNSSEAPLCVELPVAVCILSSFGASVFYTKILYEIEKHLTLPKDRFFRYITSLRKLGVPNAGASLSIPDYTEGDEVKRVIISRPLDSHIVGVEMTRTLQLLDVDILVKSIASLLLERRVLLFSSSLSNLYDCCKAISSLLYPFEWPHLIVPVLPTCLTVQCYSELPYILGMASSSCNAVLELLSEQQLLIIDVDKGSILKSCGDEDTILPKKVQKAVVTALNLAKNMTDPTEMLRDVMISEAFVHMFVEMIGHYENHFCEHNGDLTFHKEGLLKNAVTHNIRSFLQWFSESQMFDAFIEESIWRVKYRNLCQAVIRTFFEKRIDEYKWELSHGGEKLSRLIGKTMRNFSDKIRALKT